MDFFESRLFWASLRLIQLLFTILILAFTTYVINWWNEYWSAAPPLSLGLLLFSSLITPLALAYLLTIPVYFTETAFYSPALIACMEGLMALTWAGSSISTAVFISDRECFGQVCDLARAAVVLGVFQWFAFTASFGFSILFTIRIYRSTYPVIAVPKAGEYMERKDDATVIITRVG